MRVHNKVYTVIKNSVANACIHTYMYMLWVIKQHVLSNLIF